MVFIANKDHLDQKSRIKATLININNAENDCHRKKCQCNNDQNSIKIGINRFDLIMSDLRPRDLIITLVL